MGVEIIVKRLYLFDVEVFGSGNEFKRVTLLIGFAILSPFEG